MEASHIFAESRIMKRKLIPFSETHQFSELIVDYFEGKFPLRDFYSYLPEPGSFEQAIQKRKQFPCDRKILTSVLLRQYADVFTENNGVNDVVRNNIVKLENDNCFTVTTGHQLNLFTGPLFAIYKLLTIIKLSRILSEKYKENTFVPVFWMASEDHDFEEINHIHLYGKRVTWNRKPGGAVGRMDLGEIETFINEVEVLLGNNGDCISDFKKIYLESGNLAEATRRLIHNLFGKYGLVIIDGDDAELKRLFIPEMKNDLLSNTAFSSVTETSKRLSKNYKVQVQPREINLFYLGNDSRNRIEKQTDGTYSVLSTDLKFSEADILHELETHPERFSPNVVLRPVYQEKVLPNLSYTGGPGELNYWLQFRDAFNAIGIPFPVFIPRNCILLLPAAAGEKTEKLGIETEDLFLSTDYLVLKVLEKSSEIHVGTEAISVIINREFEKLIKDWMQLDPSLRPAVEAEKQKMLNSMAGLEEKARRALKRKNETVVTQVKNLKEKLFPSGGLQERHENFLTYYCRYGNEFLDTLLEQIDPFEKKFIVLSEF